jgi:hypothetical protein
MQRRFVGTGSLIAEARKEVLSAPHGKTKVGFFPLPVAEAERVRNRLTFQAEFSALDPCIGDGLVFIHLLKGTQSHRYGIEIDTIVPNKQERWELPSCMRTRRMCAVRSTCSPWYTSTLHTIFEAGSHQLPTSGTGISGPHLTLAESRRRLKCLPSHNNS